MSVSDVLPWLQLVIVLLLAAVAFRMLVIPIWIVWNAHQRGRADLAQAMNEQQVQVAQANGRLAAAQANKAAAIVEAEGVAEQIHRIGAGLTQHDLYLKWQWIRMMEERHGATIYVPTEAGLPILEAMRKPF